MAESWIGNGATYENGTPLHGQLEEMLVCKPGELAGTAAANVRPITGSHERRLALGQDWGVLFALRDGASRSERAQRRLLTVEGWGAFTLAPAAAEDSADQLATARAHWDTVAAPTVFKGDTSKAVSAARLEEVSANADDVDKIRHFAATGASFGYAS